MYQVKRGGMNMKKICIVKIDNGEIYEGYEEYTVRAFISEDKALSMMQKIMDNRDDVEYIYNLHNEFIKDTEHLTLEDFEIDFEIPNVWIEYTILEED